MEDTDRPVRPNGEIYDGNTAVKLYCAEIRLTALLSPAEEIALAARIKKGGRASTAAREDMIKANLRLVVKIAHDYEGWGLPLLDLISEGNMGLMKAVERFEPGKAKLSTYAGWWIKQFMRRALANQSRTIRLPIYMVDKIALMRRISNRLQEELGHEPSDAELAEETGVPKERVTRLRTAGMHPVSLDAPIGEDDSGSLSSLIPDDRVETAAEEARRRDSIAQVGRILETLGDRERRIIIYRFGLDGGKERTLEEVGKKFGITRERTRQIQNIALRKLHRRISKIEGLPMPPMLIRKKKKGLKPPTNR